MLGKFFTKKAHEYEAHREFKRLNRLKKTISDPYKEVFGKKGKALIECLTVMLLEKCPEKSHFEWALEHTQFRDLNESEIGKIMIAALERSRVADMDSDCQSLLREDFVKQVRDLVESTLSKFVDEEALATLRDDVCLRDKCVSAILLVLITKSIARIEKVDDYAEQSYVKIAAIINDFYRERLLEKDDVCVRLDQMDELVKNISLDFQGNGVLLKDFPDVKKFNKCVAASYYVTYLDCYFYIATIQTGYCEDVLFASMYAYDCKDSLRAFVSNCSLMAYSEPEECTVANLGLDWGYNRPRYELLYMTCRKVLTAN